MRENEEMVVDSNESVDDELRVNRDPESECVDILLVIVLVLD